MSSNLTKKSNVLTVETYEGASTKVFQDVIGYDMSAVEHFELR